MNVEECISAGLLKADKPDAAKAKFSLATAERKLKTAEKELKYGICESAMISAYVSMFHAARALLYKDGYKERSHYALCVYVAEKYSLKLERKYISELNLLRLQRHELMYGIEEREEIEETEVKEAIWAARGFIDGVRKII